MGEVLAKAIQENDILKDRLERYADDVGKVKTLLKMCLEKWQRFEEIRVVGG